MCMLILRENNCFDCGRGQNVLHSGLTSNMMKNNERANVTGLARLAELAELEKKIDAAHKRKIGNIRKERSAVLLELIATKKAKLDNDGMDDSEVGAAAASPVSPPPRLPAAANPQIRTRTPAHSERGRVANAASPA